jgi:hypothetical protein
MQLRRWGLSRAGRIVIILFVVQLLGLSPILVLPLPPTGGPGLAGGEPHGPISIEGVLSLSAVPDPTLQAIAPLEADVDRAPRPVPAPLARWLPRAPPAA